MHISLLGTEMKREQYCWVDGQWMPNDDWEGASGANEAASKVEAAPVARVQGARVLLEPIDPHCAKFLPDFLASIAKQAEELSSLAREANLQQLRRSLHDLKGLVGLFGLGQIRDRVVQTEMQVIESGPIESIVSMVEEIAQVLRETARLDPKCFPVADVAGPRG
jgi:hypothetical protein